MWLVMEHKTQPTEAIWWRRLLGWLFDLSVLVVLFRLLGSWFLDQFIWSQDGFWIVALLVMMLVIPVGYYVVCEYIWGRTIGKFVTGTLVVDLNGNKPTGGVVLLRSVLRFVLVDVLTFFSSHPIGWHDFLSGTRVVYTRKTAIPMTLSQLSERGSLRRWWQRFWVGFSALLVVCVLVVPVWTIHVWENPRSIKTDVSEWSRYDVTEVFSLKLPHRLRESRGGYQSRLTGLQYLTVTTVGSLIEVEQLIRQELALAAQAPFATLQLGTYKVRADGSGTYRYQLDQLPIGGGGFWVREADTIFHVVQFVGFGVRADDVLSAIEESTTID